MTTLLAPLLASTESLLGIVKTVLGIGGLIFVHELGHFLVGRACGVMAEAFSIGFGPVLLKWKPGETEYRLSAIPLGGYVKFLGENPDERGEISSRSFHAATYPRKAAIMLAGVTMNLVVAVLLFFFAFRGGIEVPAPVVGAVLPGSPAERAGLRPGDRIVEIDGHRIHGFEDILQETAFSKSVSIRIERDGVRLPPVTVEPEDLGEGLRMLGIAAQSDPTKLGILPGGAAAGAGVREGDRVVEVGGRPVATVPEALAEHEKFVAGGSAKWVFDRAGERVEIEMPARTWRIGVEYDAFVLAVFPAAKKAGLAEGDVPVSVDGRATPTARAFAAALAAGGGEASVVVRRGDADVTVTLPAALRPRSDALVPGPGSGPLVLSPPANPARPSAARDAGMPLGSTILAIDGASSLSFDAVIAATQAAGASGGAVKLTWRAPDGTEAKDVAIRPVAETNSDVKLLGLGSATRSEVVREESLLGAVALGIDRTHRTMMHIGMTLRSLVTGGVSPKKLSGPVAIAQMSYRKSKEGIAPFLLFLAIISMNLAVLNVLPIPLLDGGQLAIITIEKVRGKPLPERVLGAVQWAGLVLLLGFMVFVVSNDIRNLL